MTVAELSEQTAVDAGHTEKTLQNISELLTLVGNREPTIHELTALGAYVGDCYQGLENVLIRFTKFYRIHLPDGANWHAELFGIFCDSGRTGVPTLFPEPFATEMKDYRSFRHRFQKGYTMLLEWDKMQSLVLSAPALFREFYRRVSEQLALLRKP